MTLGCPGFANVVVPNSFESQDATSISSSVERWVNSAPMTLLLEHFRAPLLPTDLNGKLRELDRFSARMWDARLLSNGTSVERNQVPFNVNEDPDTEELVCRVAAALGMVSPTPPRYREYDYIVILGGLVRGNVVRSSYAAYLLKSGAVRAPKVVALTANRPLVANANCADRDEFELLRQLGFPSLTHESEVMEEALLRVFGLEQLDERVGDVPKVPPPLRRRVAASVTSDDIEVSLVVAPPDDPASGRRANTADTYRFWGGEVARLAPGTRVLVITTCIYVVYQSLVSLQYVAIPFGARVETVGSDETVVDMPLPPRNFRAVDYLQEIRSTIRAARALSDILMAD
jgi:hypothetical protein